MIRQIRYGNSVIKYSVIKSRRKKTSQITVDDAGVVIRTPTTKTSSDIQKMMKSKAHWIFKKQLEYISQKPEIPKITYVLGSKLPYLGNSYSLKILLNQNKNSIKLAHNEFIVCLTSKTPSKITIRKLYQNWIAARAKKLFSTKIAEFSQKLNTSYPELVIKNLKNRWGSITAKNVVNLNQNLLKAPSDVIDYVILHELCHLKIKEHNHNFWNYVRKYMPNYEDKMKWLELHSKRIV